MDLAGRIAASKTRGKRSQFEAYVFITIGVAASAAATISVAAEANTPTINATLTAIPGIVVMVLKTFKFEQQSKWWWEKYHGLLKIQAEQKPDGSNTIEIERQVAAFLSKHYEKWPGPEFNKPPL
jgi:hypothetical protein